MRWGLRDGYRIKQAVFSVKGVRRYFIFNAEISAHFSSWGPPCYGHKE